MEAPLHTRRSVHILRHSFRPSDALAGRLDEFVTAKSRSLRPRFLLHSSFQVAVNSIDYIDYRYEKNIYELTESFLREAGSITLDAVAYRISKEAFGLKFAVKDPKYFRELLAPLDSLPNIIEISDRNHDPALFLDIPSSQLVGRQALAGAWSELREAVKNKNDQGLIYATPEKISALRDDVYLPEIENPSQPAA